MVVQCIVKFKGKQIGLVVNNRFINLDEAIKHLDSLDNVSLVNNKFFRGKNCKILVKEVNHYDESKGIIGSLDEIQNNGVGKTRKRSKGGRIGSGKRRNRGEEFRGKSVIGGRGERPRDINSSGGENVSGGDKGVRNRRDIESTSCTVQLLKEAGVSVRQEEGYYNSSIGLNRMINSIVYFYTNRDDIDFGYIKSILKEQESILVTKDNVGYLV